MFWLILLLDFCFEQILRPDLRTVTPTSASRRHTSSLVVQHRKHTSPHVLHPHALCYKTVCDRSCGRSHQTAILSIQYDTRVAEISDRESSVRGKSDIVVRITGALIPQKPSVFPILRNHLRALFPPDHAIVNHTYRVHARARN